MIVFATLHSIEFKYAEIIFFKFSYLWERYKQNLQLLLLLYQKIWKQTRDVCIISNFTPSHCQDWLN